MQTDKERRPWTLAHSVRRRRRHRQSCPGTGADTVPPGWTPWVSNRPLSLHSPITHWNNRGRWPIQNLQVTPCADLKLIHHHPHFSCLPHTTRCSEYWGQGGHKAAQQTLGRIQVAGQVLAAQTLGCQVRDTDPTTRRRQDWGVADLSRALGLKGCTTTAWLLKPLYAYVFKLPFCLSLFFANPLPPRKPCQSITGVTVWFSSCQWREGMPWLQSNKISGGRYGNCFLLENSNLNNNQKQKTRKVLIKYLFFLFLYFWQTSCHLTWVYMSEL